MKPNYAIKPTPEQALRSSRAFRPARLIAALAIMMNLFATLAIASSQGVFCYDEEIKGSAYLVATLLEERSRGNSEASASREALFVTWRREACELLETEPELFPVTRKAIESECFDVKRLPGNNRANLVGLAREVVRERNPDLMALGWVEETKGNEPRHMLVVVSDGAFSANWRISWDREHWKGSRCEVSPSDWKR